MKCLALLLLPALGFAAEPSPWQAGVASAVITPKEPIWMAGFAARTKPSEGVRMDLYVKALALRYRDAAPAVIVTADTIGFTREMSQEIATRCQKRFGLERDRLILSASHTHSGPVVGQLGRPNYELEEGIAGASRRYAAQFADATVDVVGRAIAALQPAELSFGQSLAGFAVNRRRARDRSLPGPVDHDVPVLLVRAPGGALRAILAGYACHATALNDYKISGDWPGYFKDEFQKAHPGVEAMFVGGCGADSNALPRSTEELARRYGLTLSDAATEVTRMKLKPLNGPLTTVMESVDLPFAPVTRAQLEARLKDRVAANQRSAERLLKKLDAGEKLPTHYSYPIAVWRFGDHLTWIVLSSEVVVDYSIRLKQKYGFNNTWVSAYSNEYCGYIPSLRVLKEGGYEGGEAMPAQGHPGPWAESVEDLIVNKVDALVKRAR